MFSKLLSKYPFVELSFMQKGIREQNIENNQEIHEINKRLDQMDEVLKRIVSVLEELQNG